MHLDHKDILLLDVPAIDKLLATKFRDTSYTSHVNCYAAAIGVSPTQIDAIAGKIDEVKDKHPGAIDDIDRELLRRSMLEPGVLGGARNFLDSLYKLQHVTKTFGKILSDNEEMSFRLMADGLRPVRRIPYARAIAATQRFDYVSSYVNDLGAVLDLEAVRSEGLSLCADPLGGAGIAYWGRIAERYGLDITIRHDWADATFRFMTLDWDGAIRMDCSSPYAMAGLIALKDKFDVAWACDTDHDRHGIVARSAGLLNPNHYLAAAISYLFLNRPGWKENAGVGKTMVSSSMIDRVAGHLGHPLFEVPVGFKWFVDGLLDGSLGFGGEESAGASFLRRDGKPWSTDKDGLILGLLAAEMLARTGRDPGEIYQKLTEQFGAPVYERIDAPATPEQKTRLAALSPEQVTATEFAGDPIEAKLNRAPSNGAPLGGLKVVTRRGWFAARPSGTEDVYKIYAESFAGETHLRQIQTAAQELVEKTVGK